MKARRVVFLMSDTGAGHRSVADAIRAALDLRYPGEYVFELVDVYRRYTPFPFTYLPEIYPRWVTWAKPTWEWGYKLANTPHLDQVVMAAIQRLWRDGMRRLLDDHPGDVYVSVHALFSRPVMGAVREFAPYHTPFVTVVTDLVTTHAFWYEKGVDRCLVPTQVAYDRGLKFGLRPEQLRFTGMPIHPQFMDGLREKTEARCKLDWHRSLPTILLIGGGDGMGPVYPIAEGLNRRRLDMQLVIVAGRNHRLLRRLEAVQWNQPTLIYPFVGNMPELMAASDILVTKAGPTTISEACAAGLPMVLSDAVPGQEDGNITHVVENHAGAYAPGVHRVADTVTAWLSGNPAELACRSENARRLGSPDAVWKIADEIHAQAQRIPARNLIWKGERQPPHFPHAPEDGWLF
jgi:1,2-diacylglycerol 3-beta-galactosyltransferase